jgi:hypothetical protein
MRLSFCILGLAVAWLILSSAQAQSRGFAWFFSHSRPSRNLFGAACSRDLLCLRRRTASGQAFDHNGYTAAHRTLPFGSRVTVTNPENGKSVTVVARSAKAKGNWKLVKIALLPGKTELFDLTKDPGEKNNVASFRRSSTIWKRVY